MVPRPPRADGVSVPPENGELHEEDHLISALGVGDRVQAALWAERHRSELEGPAG
jgi:hypothetical protein